MIIHLIPKLSITFFKLICVLSLLVCFCDYCFSQSFSNKTNPNWSDSEDWTAGAPGFSTTIDATLNHASAVLQDMTFNNAITVNQDKVLLLSGDLTIAGGTTTVTGELILSSGNLTIANGGTLVIDGHLIGLSSTGNLTIEGGGTLTVVGAAGISWAGNWISTSNTASITVDGGVTVTGDFTNSQVITGTGNIDIEGTLDNDQAAGGNIFGCTDDMSLCCGLGRAAFGSTCLLPDGVATDVVSATTGDWDNAATWVGGVVPNDQDNVQILNGHTVTLNKGKGPEIHNLDIESGGKLIQDNKEMEVVGAYKNDSSHQIIKKSMVISGINAALSGIGRISLEGQNAQQSFIEIQSNASVLAGSSLIILATGETNGVVIDGAITNNGAVAMAANVSGTGSWINDNGSDLYVFEEEFGIPLTASTSFNIVHFSDVADQTVVTPTGNEYNNLIIGGGGVKTLESNITISNFLVINGTLDTDDTNDYDISIGGDWINKGTFNGYQSKVTFTGTDQIEVISETGTATFYDLELNMPGGNLLLFDNMVIQNELTMTDGYVTIDGSEQVTLGTSALSPGTLTYTAGHIGTLFERWIGTGTGVTTYYPIGIGSVAYPISFTADVGTGGTALVQFTNIDPGNNGSPWDEGGLPSPDFYNTFSDGYFQLATGNGLALGGPGTYDVDIDVTNFSAFAFGGTETVVSRNSNALPWALNGTVGALSGNSLSRTGLAQLELAIVDDANCTIPAAPTFTTSDTDVCIDEADVVYEVADLGTTYNWVINGGVQDGGGSTRSITVDWGGDGKVGSIEVYAVDAGCGSGPTTSLAVNIEPFVTSSISGRSIVSENSTNVNYSVVDNGYTYAWTVSGGTISTDNNDNIDVDWGSAGSGAVSVVADAGGGCPTATPELLDVTLFTTFNTITSGSFNTDAIWEGGIAPDASAANDIRINNGHSVTLFENTVINNLIIDSMATLTTGAYELEVQNILNVLGTGTLDASQDNTNFTNLVLNASSNEATIVGKGTIDCNRMEVVSGVWTIGATDSITAHLDSVAINNSNLEVKGTLVLTGDNTEYGTPNGVFLASAVTSSVRYTSAGSPRIFIPDDSYHNLEFDGGGTFNLPTSTTLVVDGDFVLSSGTFGHSNSLVKFSGTQAQSIEGSLSFYSATFNNSLGSVPAFTLTNSIIVSNDLTLTEGVIDTGGGSNTVTFTSLTGGNTLSYIDGECNFLFINGLSSQIFPVGDGARYAPVEIDIADAESGFISVQYFASAYPDLTLDGGEIQEVSPNEHWIIDDAGNTIEPGAGNQADYIRLYSNSATLSEIANINDVRVAKYDLTGMTWSTEDYHNSGTPSNGSNAHGTYVEMTLVDEVDNADEPFTFGGINEDALPVDYSLFKVEKALDGVDLVWVTQTEIDNDRFEIEHSIDGVGFTYLGEVEGAGDSNEPKPYYFKHSRPAQGTNYYRLKQIDFDGAFEYSKVQSVYVGDQSELDATIAPNPALNNVTLSFNAVEPNLPTNIIVLDINGKVVFDVLLAANNNRFDMNVEPLKNGIYIVRLIQGNNTFYGKMVVQH